MRQSSMLGVFRQVHRIGSAWVTARRGAAMVSTLDTAHPGDMSALSRWLQDNPMAKPRCILGKTEGNGCVNDFTRGYASHMVDAVLGARRGDASIIMSGGTEGVLVPHLLLFADGGPEHEGMMSGDKRLSYGVARTRQLAPHELGRGEQIEATRDAVLEACAAADLMPEDVCFAQIKCPLLTPDRMSAATSPCITTDSYKSMAYSRGASALGVALATSELSDASLGTLVDGVCENFAFASMVASASAGIELMHSEVFVFGNSSSSRSKLKAAKCVMCDPIDVQPIFRMLRSANIAVEDGAVAPAAAGRVSAVLAKADPVPQVRGYRTTMLSDSDVNATRHARASVAGLLAGIFGTPELYVSGGAEHQGPLGGGPVAIIYAAE